MAIQHSIPNKTATWTGIIGELILAIFKGFVGYFSDSKALLGDALYSATEAFSCLADKVPWKKAKVNGSRRSGKTQLVITILFSVLVLMGGVQIAIDAIQNLSKGNLKAPGQFSIVAIFVSFAVREGIFQFQYHVSKKRNNGKHTVYASNHRLALYTSLIVFLGVSLSVLGDMYGWPGLLYMDSISAIIVSALVIRSGYLLMVDSIYSRHPHKELVEENISEFMDTIQRVHGIITVDELKSQEVGHYVVVHVKVSVNPSITVLEGHAISGHVKKLLMNRFLHVSDVSIQVLPYDPGYPYKSNHGSLDQDIPTLLQ